MSDTPVLRLAGTDDAERMLQVIQTAFAARPPVDPPAEALGDTLDDIRDALVRGRGVIATLGAEIIGCLLVLPHDDIATIRRVSVLPDHSGDGVATMLVVAAISVARELGVKRVELLTRREFPGLLAWWRQHGFEVQRETATGFVLGRALPLAIDVPTAVDMEALGRRLAGLLRAGDVLIASGDLGAGKTTLAQGIGEGLGVQGPVISPTFVISRVHPSKVGGPAFVHVDAYRLGDGAELADIDLDASIDEAVTLVEWGEGKAEWLSPERLEILIERGLGGDERVVLLDGVGPRWAGVLEAMESKA